MYKQIFYLNIGFQSLITTLQFTENDPTLSSTYGVKRASILSQSRYFHVVDGLDLDVMHDQLEGTLPLQI